jgi:hypothetical protein
MNIPGSIQGLIHWLDAGAGSRWLRLAAILAGIVSLSLVITWKQFHGPGSEWVLSQAVLGRQLAEGKGFSTQINYPQTAALLQSRGHHYAASQDYPDLHNAPLYPLLIAAPLSLMPERRSEALFSRMPKAPDGFGGDYFLLALNLLLFWLAVWQCYDLADNLFGHRAGVLASLAVLFSVPLWEQVVAVNGALLQSVLVLAMFQVLLCIEEEYREKGLLRPVLAALLGLLGALSFLTDYSAGFLLLLVLGYLGFRFTARLRWFGLGIASLVALLLIAPWLLRNVQVSGKPLGFACQQVSLKADDPTAQPAVWRASFSTAEPSSDPNKLANKVLTQLKDSLRIGLWSGGALFMSAFFVAGLLYRFRSESADFLRWAFVATFCALLFSYAVFDSGESERLPVIYLSPLVVVFGAGFFFVLVDSSPSVSGWPRLTAACLLVLQALPLLHDATEPRRVHFHYPPYYPSLFVGLRQELERRGLDASHGVMADIPAGVAWYGRQRTWAQPSRLRDFYALSLEQPIAELLLSAKTLDRPLFSELAGHPVLPAAIATQDSRFGEWAQVYSGLFTGRFPPEFPLVGSHKLAENLYVLVDPSLPAPKPGK